MNSANDMKKNSLSIFFYIQVASTIPDGCLFLTLRCHFWHIMRFCYSFFQIIGILLTYFVILIQLRMPSGLSSYGLANVTANC